MKMKNMKIELISLFFCLLFAATTFAQERAVQNETVQITMLNGDVFIGKVISRDQSIITLETVNGTIDLISSNVRLIEQYDYFGRFKFPNPHDTKYYFGPSGIPLDKGEAYYQNLLIVLNSFSYGITENISIGAGFEFISTLNGTPFWFINPKAGFQLSEKFHLGGSLFVAGVINEGSGAIAFGSATIGTSESNVTLGLGYGFADGEAADAPALTVGVMHRVSNGIALLSENYIFPAAFDGGGYFGIHGIRILGRKNAFDIGFTIIGSSFGAEVTSLPIVGYTRVF